MTGIESQFIQQGYEIDKLKARIQELETAGRKLTNKLMRRHPSTWGEVAILFGTYKTDAIVNDVKEFAALLNNTPLEKE